MASCSMGVYAATFAGNPKARAGICSSIMVFSPCSRTNKRLVVKVGAEEEEEEGGVAKAAPPPAGPKRGAKGFCKCFSSKPTRIIGSKNSSLAIQIGALLATVAEPAVAITGVNNEEDFTWVLTQLGISAFFYFIVSPPIIMNWLRIRWYRRNLLEMYFQFMFVFMFFPGLLLWAPFLNFRKFPRDPSMKYPWSKPENPSQIKGGFLKWPYATPEDYDQ